MELPVLEKGTKTLANFAAKFIRKLVSARNGANGKQEIIETSGITEICISRLIYDGQKFIFFA